MSENAGFEIGDVVGLRSGGPKMTVSEIKGDGKIEAMWFDAENARMTATFPPAVLHKQS
jgi:uncharacterized protein YodC (DUF2158 family)